MNSPFAQSREAILHARDALRRGDMKSAREWAEQAAKLAPQSEDPWLILAAVASPRASADYIRKALQVNPNSARARKGMEWAMQRLGESPKAETASTQRSRAQSPGGSGKVKSKRRLFVPVALSIVGCCVVAFAAWTAVRSPVMASFFSPIEEPQVAVTHPSSWAQVAIPKPTYTAMAPVTPTPQVAFLQPEAPSDQLNLAPTSLPTDIPPDVPTAVAAPLDPPVSDAAVTPGSIAMSIVMDTPTSQYGSPTNAPQAAVTPQPQSMSVGSGEHWIDVDLTQQRVYAYEGNTVVNSFLVSTGTWQTPTVTGKYHIYVKYLATDMTGPGYYLPDVPYTMYFYEGYGLHGTYWHHNFGTPMSHGCVNLSIPDAEWLYNFASVGTLVNVHY